MTFEEAEEKAKELKINVEKLEEKYPDVKQKYRFEEVDISQN